MSENGGRTRTKYSSAGVPKKPVVLLSVYESLSRLLADSLRWHHGASRFDGDGTFDGVGGGEWGRWGVTLIVVVDGEGPPTTGLNGLGTRRFSGVSFQHTQGPRATGMSLQMRTQVNPGSRRWWCDGGPQYGGGILRSGPRKKGRPLPGGSFGDCRVPSWLVDTVVSPCPFTLVGPGSTPGETRIFFS